MTRARAPSSGDTSDEIWKELDEPGSDPAHSVLFPRGVACEAHGKVDGQPDWVHMLAELLGWNVVLRLRADPVKTHAKDLRAPNERVELRERVHRVLATVTLAELAALERMYESERFSASDIHAVIPDRPATPRKAAAAPTLPVSGPGELGGTPAET